VRRFYRDLKKEISSMKMKTTVLQLAIFTLLTGAVAAVPALAGSAVIGSVAGSTNASIGGQSLLPNTTVFSGDSVLVRDGVAVIAVGNRNRVVFGHDTVASFLRESNDVTVVLSRGNLSMLHPDEGTAVRVQAGSISITPLAGFKTLGEVAMVNGSVVVTAKEGSLQVQDDRGSSKNVTKGQTVVISPKTADNHGSGGGWGSNANTTLEILTLAAAGTAAILAGVALSRAGNAENSANAAIAAGNAATSAANAANSTAAAAAASAAAAAASAAEATLLAECQLDILDGFSNYSSPFALTASQCKTLP
jgi:hypothetical protein